MDTFNIVFCHLTLSSPICDNATLTLHLEGKNKHEKISTQNGPNLRVIQEDKENTYLINVEF